MKNKPKTLKPKEAIKYEALGTAEVRTIAIVLNDNDFGGTLEPLLESIHRAIDWNDGLTEEVIKTAIYAGIRFHYVAFQHARNFGEPGYGTIDNTVDYLTENIEILFNEKAEADILNVSRDGGAWYLSVQSGTVSHY